jgi:hypothetical protein
VVGAGGALGGYGGSPDLKRQLLRAEGLDVGFSGVRSFRAVRWPPTLHAKAEAPALQI